MLPPRLLLTRESIARSSVNTIASLNHIGPETNSVANTPLLQHAPTTRLFTALENIRNPSARGSSGRHVNSAHSSISAGLRQPVHVTPNTLRRASRAQQSRQQATISNANSYSGTERRWHNQWGCVSSNALELKCIDVKWYAWLGSRTLRTSNRTSQVRKLVRNFRYTKSNFII